MLFPSQWTAGLTLSPEQSKGRKTVGTYGVLATEQFCGNRMFAQSFGLDRSAQDDSTRVGVPVGSRTWDDQGAGIQNKPRNRISMDLD